jgi:glycosyltransferase involved in cell wall biosynthesis
LVTHNLTGCGFGTPSAIQRAGIRWLHVLHDVQLFQPSGRLRARRRFTLWQRWWAGLRKAVLGRPDLVLSPTRWLLDEHTRRGFFRDAAREILPNPAPPFVRVSREPRRPLRLLFVGTVSAEKGAVFLRRLVKTLFVPFELAIVGEGKMLVRLRGAGRFIVAHGALPKSHVLERMKEADILLMPSQIAENQPTVILEAASVGLPVIASDVGGIPETLGTAGIVCPRNQLDAWHTALNRLQDWEFYQDQVKRMEALARAHEPAAYAQRFLSLLVSKR